LWTNRFRICIVAAACVCAARSAAGDPIIYTNLDPPPGYLLDAPYESSDTSAHAMEFQPFENAVLTSVSVPIQWYVAGFAIFRLGRSQNGVPVGPPIESWTIPRPAGAADRSITWLTAPSTVQPLLFADTRYFLLVVGDIVFWPRNNAGIQGPVTLFTASPFPPVVTTGTLGAFQLEGQPQPTPEPGTMLLVVTGIALTACRFRRRAINR
jgi:hypothetical protein